MGDNMNELAISAMKALDQQNVKIVVHSKFFGHTETVVCRFKFAHRGSQIGFWINDHHVSLDDADITYCKRNAGGHFFSDQYMELTIFPCT